MENTSIKARETTRCDDKAGRWWLVVTEQGEMKTHVEMDYYQHARNAGD
jgi:hypothetical protein